jgi:hypothetical protein
MAGGGGGKNAEEDECKKKGVKEEGMVVEKRKLDKEDASGPAGFGPQAQSGEVHGRCKGPILGSMCDPALHYLLMVDDASRYVTVEFLKSKDQAAQKVKNYFTHLEVQGRMPKAIRIDRGHEFVNDSLLEWLYLKGMEVHMTTPHSPSQNRVAEQMNQTLEELARAMHLAANLPVFLWEQAITHAAYVQNRAYSSAVKTATPYERWHGHKPDVSHLREFGAPVWILL